ncbi:MAG: VWA domain-containing protein [Polyangiaceae bacterium]
MSLAAGCGARSGLDAAQLSSDVSPSVPCQTGVFELRHANPALLFVIDRSMSMQQSMAGGRSRWATLGSALADTLPPVDSSIEIGALLFPALNQSQGASCSVASSPDLMPALNHVGRLLALVNDNAPGGSTPTADAIAAAARALRSLRAAQTARALVLATDGAPDCNTALDPDTCTCLQTGNPCRSATRCLDDQRTVGRIADAATLGLPTYVIGIQDQASSVNAQVLDAMADAGGRPLRDAAHRYYAATSEAELSDALGKIRDQVGACTYLTASVPDVAGTISVSLDGSDVAYDESGQSGWSWASRENGEITLGPGVCPLARRAGAHIEARLTCAAP